MRQTHYHAGPAFEGKLLTADQLRVRCKRNIWAVKRSGFSGDSNYLEDGVIGRRSRFSTVGRGRPARLRRADGGSSGTRLPGKGGRGRWAAVLEG